MICKSFRGWFLNIMLNDGERDLPLFSCGRTEFGKWGNHRTRWFNVKWGRLFVQVHMPI